MKSIHLLNFLLLLTFSFCLEKEEYKTEITFKKNEVKISKEEVVVEEGNVVVIEQPGSYYATGETEEGFIVIRSSSVKLYLENLKLASSKNAPIIVIKDLKDVEIINLKNIKLTDLEEKGTDGECAVIKVKKNSIVSFKNDDIFTLEGKCKNIIKGVSNASIIFKGKGEYIINARKTAIDSDGLLEFNGGTFVIESEDGDAIRSIPDVNDTVSLGKILINDGTFNIHCYNDAFSAKNNITIVNGKFDIKTEEGFDSETFNQTESSKGFKLTNNEEGCEMKIYNGKFILNVADDAFRSNRDLTILSGNFNIKTKDDAICAKYNLVLGEEDDKDNENLNIKISSSYEAIEGMTVTIYSGKISASSKDDGINASGVIKKQRRGPRPGNNSNWNFTRNDTNRNESYRNRSRDDFDPFNGGMGGRNHTPAPPNDSYIINIYGGEIYLFTNSDGIDANGHLYIHGGNINIFSEGKGANEPIDHNGNFTLFNAEILGVGTGGLMFVHADIKKGNQMYGFHSGVISKDKKLEIQDENNKIVKEGLITKDINYIFYTSLKLNDKYHFYIIDEIKHERTLLNITYGRPPKGEDDEDKNYKNTNNKNSSKNLKTTILGLFIILFLF